jgi:hypothetical protein
MPKNKTLAIFLLLTIATFASGFQNSPEWVKYTSIEGRYNVLMPKQPKLSAQEGTASTGEKMSQYMAQVSDADSLYSLAYFDYGTSMTFSLDKARDGVVASIQGTLLDQQSISLGGHAGREFKVAAKHQNIDILLRARVYDIGGRVYILQHLFKKADDVPRIAAKSAKFFDSFKVNMSK